MIVHAYKWLLRLLLEPLFLLFDVLDEILDERHGPR